MDCSPPGSSVHGIFQARVLEWGAIAFSKDRCYLVGKGLVICMAVDFVTGVAVAALGRSDKSETGRISSNSALTGLMKKGFELLVILIAAQLESVTGFDYIRNVVVCFFIGTEGISILENGGLLGVPLPAGMKRWFEALRDRGDEGLPPGEG